MKVMGDHVRRSAECSIPMRQVPAASTALNAANHWPCTATSAASFTAWFASERIGLWRCDHATGGNGADVGRVDVEGLGDAGGRAAPWGLLPLQAAAGTRGPAGAAAPHAP